MQSGRLAAGVYPGAHTVEKARQQVFHLLDVGVNTFIDLTHPSDRLHRYEALLGERPEIKAEHFEFPIVDVSIPDTALMEAILDCVDDALTRGRVAYIHCIGGVGRTGTVVGCHMVRHGLSGREALAKIAELRSSMPVPDRWKRSPETGAQEEMVMNWMAGR